MNKLIVLRFIAFGLDYLIIIAYAMLLFGITTYIEVGNLSPYLRQLVGFLTLTLPVFFYFYLMEKSSSGATIGKRVMNIYVQTTSTINSQKVLFRNILKFLPWEIAHFGVHWVVYYSTIDKTPPTWVWITLILPQVVVFGYILSIIFYRGESSLYDKIANTRIVLNK